MAIRVGVRNNSMFTKCLPPYTRMFLDNSAMSQAYESYHLRSDSQQEAKDVIERAGLHAYVFPAANGWVSFAAEGEPFAINEKLLAANAGYLLQFAYSEDHGWTFVIIKHREIVFAYDSPGLDYPGTSAAEAEDARFSKHFPWLSEEARKQLWVLLFARPGSEDHLSIAFQFAELIGLVNYKEISYETLSASPQVRHGVLEI